MTNINTEMKNCSYCNRLMVDTGKLYRVYSSVQKMLLYFVARDKMNASIHLTTPVWSPITEQAEYAKVALEELMQKGDKK